MKHQWELKQQEEAEHLRSRQLESQRAAKAKQQYEQLKQACMPSSLKSLRRQY